MFFPIPYPFHLDGVVATARTLIICLCTDLRQGTRDFVLSECCGICMRSHNAVVREEERNVKVQNRYICHWFRTYGILYSMLGINLMKTLSIRGYRFFCNVCEPPYCKRLL